MRGKKATEGRKAEMVRKKYQFCTQGVIALGLLAGHGRETPQGSAGAALKL